jgi:sugar O-acyltransferase (sialic acid O-acetyltransferase NeuD family)
MKQGLLVLGFGGHARSVADVALSAGYRSLRFVDPMAADGESLEGFEVTRDMPVHQLDGWSVLPASGNASKRRTQAGQARSLGYDIATLVSPHAYVSRSATLASGCFVAHGAHVGAYAQVGEGCILNTHCVIDHECVIGDYTHVSVNATIAGRCRIGTDVMIGAGATIIDGIAIGDHVTVGAGAVAVADLPANATYVGVPARALG